MSPSSWCELCPVAKHSRLCKLECGSLPAQHGVVVDWRADKSLVCLVCPSLQYIYNAPIALALLRQLDDSIISMIAEFFTGENPFARRTARCASSALHLRCTLSGTTECSICFHRRHAEIHFDIPEMRGSFGFNLTTKLPAVIDEIQGFRMKGLRIHYWP